MEARDGDVPNPGRAAASTADPDAAAPDDTDPPEHPAATRDETPGTAPTTAEAIPDTAGTAPDTTPTSDAEATADAGTPAEADPPPPPSPAEPTTPAAPITSMTSITSADSAEPAESELSAPTSELSPAAFPRSSVRPPRPDVSGGIGCAALLLPLIAVAGAVLCFFAGVLSTASGCSANGSALCSSNGPWYAFALPVFVSPLIAAGAAIAAVTVRRHRSTWLAVGYGIVFVSIIVGLAVASTGSS